MSERTVSTLQPTGLLIDDVATIALPSTEVTAQGNRTGAPLQGAARVIMLGRKLGWRASSLRVPASFDVRWTSHLSPSSSSGNLQQARLHNRVPITIAPTIGPFSNFHSS